MSIHYYVLDAQGNPRRAEPMEWAEMFQKIETRSVKREYVGGLLVSTVFLGLDHNFFGQGPPVLWETMVFRKNPAKDYWWWVPNWVRKWLPLRWIVRLHYSKQLELEGYTERCAGNWEQAEAMHRRVVDLVKQKRTVQ